MPQKLHGKKPGKSAPPPLPPDVVQALAEVDSRLNARRADYLSFAAANRGLPSQERAEGWLSFVSAHQWDYGDSEALVYLRSRGHSCDDEVAELIASWKSAAEASVRECARGITVFHLGTGETHKERAVALHDVAQGVRRFSSDRLRNFWGFSDSQEITIDATMLRTAEWCEVGGFDEWWHRLARERRAGVRHGVELPIAAYTLFAFARSPLAIQLMSRTLAFVVETAFLANEEGAPWEIYADALPPRRQQAGLIPHIPAAASLCFAVSVLGKQPGLPDGATLRAAELLLSCQHENGAWPDWADDPGDSIEATAMAVHALALAKPRGWQHALRTSERWLLSAQHEDGRWTEPGEPDPVWLTVLVLDALSLCQESDVVTFRLAGDAAAAPKRRERQDYRFQVGLSFPGEHRDKVSQVAQCLAAALGQKRVLFDEFHQAELARIDLDIHLQRLYHDDSRLNVVFLCKEYRKEWCGLEWRAIRDLIKQQSGERVMLVRFDDATVPGIFGIDGFVDFRKTSPGDVARLILDKLATLR